MTEKMLVVETTTGEVKAVAVPSGGGQTNYLADYGLITDTITTSLDYGNLT